MIKYVPEMTSVVMEEIPDMVCLAVDISNCLGQCEGCHSPFLMDNIGRELTPAVVDALISDNFGVNCFLLLGEGNDQKAFLDLARNVKSAHKDLALAIYSGRTEVDDEFYSLFDYVKVGPYIPSRGPLNNRKTNQRLYHIVKGQKIDITSRFWHHGIDPNVK